MQKGISADDFCKYLFGRIAQLLTNIKKSSNKEFDQSYKENLFGILNMIKPIKGKLRRNGKDICFYDEREWRFLPTIPYNTLYKDCRYSYKRKKFNKKLKPLGFQSSDIKYIIVSQEDELSYIWDEIEKIEKYSSFEKKLLCSKVISAQAIQKDF